MPFYTYDDPLTKSNFPVHNQTVMYIVRTGNNFFIKATPGGYFEDRKDVDCYWPVDTKEFLAIVEKKNLQSEMFPNNKLTTELLSRNAIENLTNFFRSKIPHLYISTSQQSKELIQKRLYGTSSQQSFFNNNDSNHYWIPPKIYPYDGWGQDHKAMLTKLMKEYCLTYEQAIEEINELNQPLVSGLNNLYQYGVRGHHLRNLRDHIVTNHPEFGCVDEKLCEAIEGQILLCKMSVDDALAAVRQMDYEKLSSISLYS